MGLPQTPPKAYHGGFKRNFRLFIRERSFSYEQRDDNNGDDENALRLFIIR